MGARYRPAASATDPIDAQPRGAVASARWGNDMALSASLDVVLGDAVTFVFRVHNPGPDPIEVTFPTGQVADVRVVADRGGNGAVWQWSDGKLFTQALSTRTIQPDDHLDEEMTWEEPAAGSYTAVATLVADVDAEARAAFTV